MTGADGGGLGRLNGLSAERAEAELMDCCGSRAWARTMAAARPFEDVSSLLEAADGAWWALSPADWLEAFRAHPRIGERKATPTPGGRSARWSASEQEGTRAADTAVLEALEKGNRAYEARFGHIFLICATGRSAEEMLDELHTRLHNDPATEVRVAAEEQRRITRIRLRKLVGSAPGD